jgi:hypothetical protein
MQPGNSKRSPSHQLSLGNSKSDWKNHYFRVFDAPITMQVKMAISLCMKTIASILVVAALTLLMATLVLREVPTVVVAAPPALQPNPHSPTPPPPPHVHSSPEAAAAGECLPKSHCGENVPNSP